MSCPISHTTLADTGEKYNTSMDPIFISGVIIHNPAKPVLFSFNGNWQFTRPKNLNASLDMAKFEDEMYDLTDRQLFFHSFETQFDPSKSMPFRFEIDPKAAEFSQVHKLGLVSLEELAQALKYTSWHGSFDNMFGGKSTVIPEKFALVFEDQASLDTTSTADSQRSDEFARASSTSRCRLIGNNRFGKFEVIAELDTTSGKLKGIKRYLAASQGQDSHNYINSRKNISFSELDSSDLGKETPRRSSRRHSAINSVASTSTQKSTPSMAYSQASSKVSRFSKGSRKVHGKRKRGRPRKRPIEDDDTISQFSSTTRDDADSAEQYTTGKRKKTSARRSSKSKKAAVEPFPTEKLALVPVTRNFTTKESEVFITFEELDRLKRQYSAHMPPELQAILDFAARPRSHIPENIPQNQSTLLNPRSKFTGFGICVFPRNKASHNFVLKHSSRSKVAAAGYVYEGQLSAGLKHGKGLVYEMNDDITQPARQVLFVGEFVHDEICGIGTFFSHNGDRFDGEFNENKFNGIGRLIQHKSISREKQSDKAKCDFLGEWQEHQRCGQGVLTVSHPASKDTLSYDGEWWADSFEGHGKLKVPMLGSYVGNFSKGEWNGRGATIHETNGVSLGKYEGSYKSGLRHGRGWYRFFKAGKLVAEFEGRFKDDDMEGIGLESSNVLSLIDICGDSPISLKEEDGVHEEWMLPIKRQGEMKFVHLAAGFDEHGT